METTQTQVGFYVTVRERPEGGRTGFLVGPLETREEALALVEPVREYAESRNSRARWYAFGTARIETVGEPLLGRFNEHFGLTARA